MLVKYVNASDYFEYFLGHMFRDFDADRHSIIRPYTFISQYRYHFINEGYTVKEYFKRAVIIYRPGEKCIELARKTLNILKDKDLEVRSYWVDDVLKDLLDNVDIVIGIGGDGTLLKISRLCRGTSPLIIPIPCGRRTVLYEKIADQVEEIVEQFFSGKFFVELYDRMRIKYGDQEYFSLNEALLISTDRGKVIRFYLKIVSPSFSSKLVFEGDGLLIGSSIGSAAYSLSVGGPLIDADTGTFFVTPLNSMELNIRPIVLSCLSKVSVTSNGYIELYIDGEKIGVLAPWSRIDFEHDYKCFRIVRFNIERDYLRDVFDKRKLVFE